MRAALMRVRSTRAQSGLPAAERASNVRDCFAIPAGAAAGIRGRRIALVDDVLTTGSTCEEALRILREAGAAGVEIWTASRA